MHQPKYLAGLLGIGLCFLVPGCGQKFFPGDELSWAVGDWHGTRTAADDGKANSMVVRVESLATGQVERLQVEGTSRPYVGFTLRSRDPASGKWMMIYANSTRPSIGRLDGKLEDKQSTWESMKEGVHGSRFVSEQIDAMHWKRTQFVSEDGGKSWKTLFTDDLERDAKTQP